MKEGTAREMVQGKLSPLLALKKGGFLVSGFWDLSVQTLVHDRVAFVYSSWVNARTTVILIKAHGLVPISCLHSMRFLTISHLKNW